MNQRLTEWLLRRVQRPESSEIACGDLLEKYRDSISQQRQSARAGVADPTDSKLLRARRCEPSAECDGYPHASGGGYAGACPRFEIDSANSPSAPARIENVAPGPFNVTVRSTNGDCFGVTQAWLDLRKVTAPERGMVVFQPLSSINGTAAIGCCYIA